MYKILNIDIRWNPVICLNEPEGLEPPGTTRTSLSAGTTTEALGLQSWHVFSAPHAFSALPYLLYMLHFFRGISRNFLSSSSISFSFHIVSAGSGDRMNAAGLYYDCDVYVQSPLTRMKLAPAIMEGNL